jgi:RHS repeat-associated protein
MWQANVSGNRLTNSTNSYHYLHTDHLATPILGTDKAGSITWKGASEAFGATKPTIQTTEMNLRFPGQYWDRETNTHFNFNRDYLPQTGRYVQSDPIGLKDGVNIFIYVINRPLRRVDPLGLANSGAVTWGRPKSQQIEEECCGKIPDLKDDLINACALVSTNVKDLELKQCLQDRCKSGTVTCDGFWCWRLNFSSSSETYGWNFMTSNANLCVSANPHIDQQMGWGCVVIHEWAHSCGWQHKGGQNIPDGTNGLNEFLSICRSMWNPSNKGPGRY